MRRRRRLVINFASIFLSFFGCTFWEFAFDFQLQSSLGNQRSRYLLENFYFFVIFHILFYTLPFSESKFNLHTFYA